MADYIMAEKQERDPDSWTMADYIMAEKQERDPDSWTMADSIMVEVSHSTGHEPLEGDGLEELCALLEANDIVVESLSFYGPMEHRLDRHTVDVRFGGQQKELYIPLGLEVEYTDLMQAIRECTNLKSIFMRQDFSLCNDVLCVQFCKALCENHSVSKLIINLTVDGSQHCQPNFDIFLNQVVVMLESNVGLKDFIFVFDSLHAPTFWSSDGFANALERNRTLERFGMTLNYLPSEQELQRLVQPLIADGNGQQKNSTLIKLELNVHERVDEESLTVAANVLAKMLQNNSSLKELSFWAQDSRYSVDSFAEALETNHTLEHLDLKGSLLNFQRLLQPLTMDANGQQSNATLLKLTLTESTFVEQDDMQSDKSIVYSLTKMLQRNSSLKELDLSFIEFFTESDVCALIKSLENNYSLQVLDLTCCDGASNSVFPAIMDMLVVNKTLKDICLEDTELEHEGKSKVVQQELKKNAMYMYQLNELPKLGVFGCKIRPWVNQLWPPEGDNRVTNMDVVFFSDLKDERTAPLHWKPRETWVQKGHPEVCWPKQWLPEDLGSNVRIFEIRPIHFMLTRVLDHNDEKAALQKLGFVAEGSVVELYSIISKDKDRQGCPLVFVGHGYGGWVLKQALVELHNRRLYEDLQSNLCGIVFYGGTNTKFRALKDWLLDDHLLELSKRFEAALDLKKVKVCVVNKNKSFSQEIKDYSDLESQFNDVMDSNDICTPTSKEDPSYYTLLEFLQQFLPKGLHQTIDDKKGQEVRFKSSETKDKEALGDMETATSTRENRDKEMDERQCVVQDVHNVDQDDEEAHKLQIFKDASIFARARENVEMNSIEFLFLDAQCMSKVVGVGLQQSLVTVTNDNDVKVEALSESAWESLLASVFMEVQDSGAFELIGFKMPKMEEYNIKTMSSPLPSKDVAKQFGVGLKDFHGNHFVTMNKREQNNMFFPVIWEVAKEYKAFKQGDPHVTKRPSGVGSSTGASGASSSGSSQQGKEEGKSVRSWSLSKPSTWWEYGKGDEKDDEGKPPGGDPPPNSGPSSEPEMVPRTYTVKVYPEAGRKFRDAREIPPQIKTASMKPKLTIVFFRDKTGTKFLNVTTQTQCNLGCDADTERYFGWFQDDIKISFGGSLPECEGTELKDFSASVEGGEKGELTKETTNITLGGSTSVANLESRGMFGQGMIAGFGMQVQVQEDTTNTFGQKSSRADTEEIIGVKQIEGFNVHNQNFEEDLIYMFCIPGGIRKSNNPMRFLRYKDTFTPIIVGKWDVSKENASEAAEYIFKVERHLFHIEQGPVTLGRGRPQDYVLEMFINLAMTHLDGLRSDKTIEIRERSFVGPAIQVFPVQ